MNLRESLRRSVPDLEGTQARLLLANDEERRVQLGAKMRQMPKILAYPETGPGPTMPDPRGTSIREVGGGPHRQAPDGVRSASLGNSRHRLLHEMLCSLECE